MKLRDYFERIFVINLPHETGRKERLIRHFKDNGLADPDDIVWVRAISGEMCPPPDFFKAGGGAWGCLQSHTRIAQDALMDRLENYVVFEDDVIFHQESTNFMKKMMDEMPDDWGQIYLGGQHLKDPEPVDGSPFLFRARNINRTHAFALSRAAFPFFTQHIGFAPDYISRGPWHIDHQLGIAHERGDWQVYAPSWWIAGQGEGQSHISGRFNPKFWWHYHGYGLQLPFVFVGGLDYNIARENKYIGNLHFGNNLKSQTFEDVGLDACVGSPASLQAWLKMISGEAISQWKIPAISHPEISVEEVSRNWGAKVLKISDVNIEDLLNYPMNGLFPHPINSKVECFGRSIRKTSAA